MRPTPRLVMASVVFPHAVTLADPVAALETATLVAPVVVKEALPSA